MEVFIVLYCGLLYTCSRDALLFGDLATITMSAVLALTILAFIPLAPFFALFSIRQSLRCLGLYLRHRTRVRRRTILTLAKREIEVPEGDQETAQRAESDDDWERIDDLGAASAPNGQPMQHADWDGIIGFFHPFCAAGGGGERVLWAAIRATQQRWPRAICVVYTGDHEFDRTAMIDRVQKQFGIPLRPATLHFVYLSARQLVVASSYPRFTLLGQSIGSVGLAYEAFSLLVPDIFIDTMGYSFALAFCKYLLPHAPTAAYVHYPTISTDMLDSLDDATGEKGVNAGAGTGWRGRSKKLYWQLFARLYSWAGRHVDVVMCNSSWTQGHISVLWKPTKVSGSFSTVIYPPCPVEEMRSKIEVSRENETCRQNLILYIAQFRPEKNHSLILHAFAEYYRSAQIKPRLVLIGSVRSNAPDEKHVYNLRLMARELKINDATTFVCDADFPQVQEYLRRASIGVNGMWNEHFGIVIVEYIAAGLIPVVHDSGGPKLDIVVPYDGQPIGYHATTDAEYAECFRRVLAMSEEDRFAMRFRARKSAERFSEAIFAQKWNSELGKLIRMKALKLH